MTNDSALMSMLVEDCLEDLDRKIDLIIEMDNIAEQLDTAIEVSLEEQLHTQYEEQFEEASEAHCHALEKQLETALEREFERKAQIADIAIPRTFSRLYKSNIEGRIREIGDYTDAINMVNVELNAEKSPEKIEECARERMHASLVPNQ
eukprot:CAMPEP_0118675892 /NCGR_PEP_ID=MMETSP0800-20121206/1718_1 /TAXON_ID=210618 ORGANISM="Striatella unipunctata, Strain CCMP2910" /NCGR_SAMPLE_ID=MMETSP0800 /ASSEMBLY_ACC=CAM_ASM_000638 /LENGTH=148 /DNA_ID=CAMNT_0006571293 /DNA_START=265 /DNA_END=712 /DNA_ORIENTATION=-